MLAYLPSLALAINDREAAPVAAPAARRVTLARGRTCPHIERCRLIMVRGVGRCTPAFAIIGTPKSGTTNAFAYLSQHPLVRGPPQKELRVFSPVLAPARGQNLTLQAYTLRFKVAMPTDCIMVGEASPAYFYHSLAARFFAEQAASVRLILLLRHPVGRWLSEFYERLGSPLAKQAPDRAWMMASTFAGLVGRAEKVRNHLRVDVRCGSYTHTHTHTHTHKHTHTSRRQSSNATATRPSARQPQEQRPCCVAPVTYNSWYDLFMPMWLRRVGDGRLHVRHSLAPCFTRAKLQPFMTTRPALLPHPPRSTRPTRSNSPRSWIATPPVCSTA